MAPQTAKVYREILKSINKNIGKEGYKSHFGEFVTEEFRKSSTSNLSADQPSIAQQKLKLARDYTFMLNCIHHHKDLLLSYNIAVDRSNEMKKVLGKSAASVGLQLPDVYQP